MLERGLQDVLMVLQGITSSRASGVSHSLAEIRRSFPVTNWRACEALMRSATSRCPGAVRISEQDPNHQQLLRVVLRITVDDELVAQRAT
ncbi:MAG: hypothetical protein ACI89X_004930, partial [Planctomycetota bacterium]